VKRRLERVPLPREAEARERAWAVVRTAHAGREPVPAPARRRLWPSVAVAAGAAGLAAAFTSPGMAVLDSIRHAVGVEHAQPALFSLPAQGRVLAVSAHGAWVVQPDGSKRRLGSYGEAAWSPFGHFVAATTANELSALTVGGDVRWSLARPGPTSPAWGGSLTDTRIAYVSRGNLRVVAGDGTGDRLLAPAEPGPLAWRPGRWHLLASVSASEIRLQDTDTGAVLRRANAGPAGPRATALTWSADGRRLLLVSPAELLELDTSWHKVRDLRGRFAAAALSPSGELAYAETNGATSDVRLGNGRRVFAGTGEFSGLAWSPDGRWLLVAWPTANQWVFVRVAGPRRIVAASAIAGQFGGAFPRLAGWCC
jgi:WD40-like Beta Propeller Repeat